MLRRLRLESQQPTGALTPGTSKALAPSLRQAAVFSAVPKRGEEYRPSKPEPEMSDALRSRSPEPRRRAPRRPEPRGESAGCVTSREGDSAREPLEVALPNRPA